MTKRHNCFVFNLELVVKPTSPNTLSVNSDCVGDARPQWRK